MTRAEGNSSLGFARIGSYAAINDEQAVFEQLGSLFFGPGPLFCPMRRPAGVIVRGGHPFPHSRCDQLAHEQTLKRPLPSNCTNVETFAPLSPDRQSTALRVSECGTVCPGDGQSRGKL